MTVNKTSLRDVCLSATKLVEYIVWRPEIYAIVETGGKQYRVTEGQTVTVDRLQADEGGAVELDRVLLIADGDNVTVGNPVIEGARVTATTRENGRADKIIVFKYKPKVRYRRKNGHRQHYTRLSIDRILPPGAEAEKPAKKTTRRRKKEVVAETEVKEDGA
jgi:large subunit ribosomal protein L21